MNKNSINKANLFLTGIINRFSENQDIFKEINISFKSGLKEFKGSGTEVNGKIIFNYSGKTKTGSFSEITSFIIKEMEKYESAEFNYIERGSGVKIWADNKNVTMKNIKTEEIELNTPLLNRKYYIEASKAGSLLKAIDIMTKDGKIKNDKIRKYNQIDHYVELLEGVIDKLPGNRTLNILDCGCGKSYLSFVLNYYLTEVKKMKCNFIGIDISPKVIEASKKMAEELNYRNMEFYAMDIKEYKPNKNINMVLSLHACDTATDLAISMGVKTEAEAIIAVPCCHKEILNSYTYEPFKSILKHGVLKSRIADALTDGMRALYLESLGYETSVIEYISPLETPKNIMIRAIKSGEENDELMQEYYKLMAALNVTPALYKYLNDID
ncbi:MAG: SAM-dependent methyltransferase [Bacillota bacterium]|nr:SAM-dependent methyltransferase [Bacillota bacterium]